MQFFGLELVPLLMLGLLNGWVLLVIFYFVELLLVLSFPKKTRGKLFEYDHSKWQPRHRIYLIVGKTFSLIILILIIFTPMKIGTAFFYIGTIIYTIGLVGFIIALINFRNTPPGQPVTHGLYRYSRNPQVLTIIIVMIGIGFAVGSGVALLFLLISTIFTRARLIEEEKACLEQYGEAYREYLERVPRYLFIRTKMKG